MTGPGWNYAAVWETVAAERADADALVHGDRRISWRELDAHANGVAAALVADGAAHQDRVACYLYNCPEYLETVFAACKAGLVPVNTNYRYGSDELAYLWDDADAVAVVFHGCFSATIASLRHRVPRVRTWLWVDDGSEPCPAWAVPYAAAARSGDAPPVCQQASGDDVMMIYTGGTTGLPKGVIWRQHDLYRCFDTRNDPELFDAAAVRARVRSEPPAVGVPAAPVMHATGFMFALSLLNQGGTVVTLTARSFDPHELLAAVERERVSAVAMVGDAFARPVLDVLDAAPGRYELASVQLVVSAGVMLSAPVKAGLARHMPGALVVDLLGSTEAHGMGTAVASASGGAETARFRLGGSAFVLDDDGRPLPPGAEGVGRLAVAGFLPLGYHKDPEKSAATFVTIGDARYSVPGDWARLERDGTITLLGRGSVCINTGGEKVFPEEVEEALKTHPAVRDAIVVGVPDQRFGEAVVAAVEVRPGVEWSAEALREHVKDRLAGFKAPRHVVAFGALQRGPNGKADYRGTRERVVRALGQPVPTA